MKEKPDIVIRLHSGLANRMFQYAFYLYLQKKGYRVWVDDRNFRIIHAHEQVDWQHIFPQATMMEAPKRIIFHYGGGGDVFSKVRRNIPHASRVWWRIKDPTFRIPNKDELKERPYLIGYFQRADMVEEVEEQLRQDFLFAPFTPNTKNEEWATLMAQEESVGIHIRKAHDYTSLPWFENTCTAEYYAHAIDYMKQHLKNPRFFLFADDLTWAKKHLPEGCEWVEGNPTSGWGSHFDLQLMSCCKHNIIANSTYSWWAAFLNQNPNKQVVMPAHWFNPKLYPQPDNALQAKGWGMLD